MKKINFSIVPFGVLFFLVAASSVVYGHGVAEIAEGTVRKVYVDKPLVGAKGYIVGDWNRGKVRVEVKNFPSSNTGYEVFLFQIDIKGYVEKMFVGGDPRKGIVPNPPAFADVGALISKWKSLGDLQMADGGGGTLEYRGGDNLYQQNFNMVMVFEKVTAGPHEGPEDFSKLMVECNGPLPGTMGAAGMDKAITVFPKPLKT